MDRKLEVVTNGGDIKGLFALRFDGTPLPGWPVGQNDSDLFLGPVTIADIDGDYYPEVLVGKANSKIYA